MSTTSSQKTRVRFAPSPTGFVHFGSLRTALFNFLYARHTGGALILRIEDTDQNRYVDGAVENLLRVMHQLGIDFDEGLYWDAQSNGESGTAARQGKDEQGKVARQDEGESGTAARRGEHGPYVQSERLDIYKEHVEQLVFAGHAYYCFCDETRLEELRKEQLALKKPPMYDRLCRNLTKNKIAAKLDEFKSAGKRPVIRQAIPLNGQTTIHDLVYGDIVFEHATLDDQILLKSDGFPTYHLAVVVDDHLMNVTHVLRGEEWISSTPKHLLLYEAFGWQPTLFAHLPLILNKDKSKLSKRQGDVSVEDFLAKGYVKEALLNFVAFLGWNPKTEQEIFSLNDLVNQFDLNKINKAPAIFDLDKLDWVNGLYIRAKRVGELTALIIPYWVGAGYLSKGHRSKDGNQHVISALDIAARPDYLQRIVELERERLKKLSDIGDRTRYFFVQPEYEGKLLVWKKTAAEEIKIKLSALHAFLSALDEADFEQTTLETKLKRFIAKNNFDNGSVLWPLRVALTGLEKSPSPFEVASTLALGLGQQAILERIQIAIKKL